MIKDKVFGNTEFRHVLIDQLIYHSIGRGFINPQAACLGLSMPLLKPLPVADALELINVKLIHHKLLK